MESRILAACFFAMALAAVSCGNNSDVVGFFADGGPAGSGAAGSGAAGAPGSGGTTGVGGSGGAGGSVNPFPCNGPAELTSPPSGYVMCTSGMIHRPEKRQCPETIPRASTIDAGADCHRDADCTAKPHGHCEWLSGLTQTSGTICVYGCVRDEECAAGQICLCGEVTGTCVGSANCVTDSDCGGSLLCAGYYEVCEQTRFACQSPEDTCGGSGDCQSTPSCPGCNACIKTGTKASCAMRCVAIAQ